MWVNKYCTNTNIKGGLLSEDPTTDDINYPTPFIGWTEDEKVYFHIGSGRWVDISASGGGGGSGVESINGQKGAITITAKDPLKITGSGKTFDLSLEEKYIKTINGIDPTNDGDFTIDKTDPITITSGTNKVTVGSTGGGGNTGIETITLDNGVLDEKDIELKGDSKQGVKITITAASTNKKKKYG